MNPVRSKIRLVAAMVAALVALSASPALAAPGELDTTFGGDGRVITHFNGGAEGHAVAIQPTGKIVVVGRAGGNTNPASDARFALARYDPNGTLDTTFGGDGKVATEFTPHSDIANAVAIQPDGKIVVAGRAGGKGGRFAVARYKLNGTLDTTFGGDGRVTTNFTGGDDRGNAVAVADGKIVVAGDIGEFALARYNSNGTLDATFGGDGKVTTHVKFGGGANAVAVQGNGKVVAAGGDPVLGRFALARLNPNGTLDTNFSGDGRITTHIGQGEESATGLAIQGNGKIVAAGYTDVPHEAGDTFGPGKFALARYALNGALDAGFGGDGKVKTRFGDRGAVAHGVAIQGDGKIVAVGDRGGKFALARYHLDGTLDSTFGGDGRVTATFASEFPTAKGVAIQENGRIVAAGSANGFAVARFLG